MSDYSVKFCLHDHMHNSHIMNLKPNLLLLSVLFLVLSRPGNAGGACFPACITTCLMWTGGPAAFAGAIGIAIDYTGCWGVCLAACATLAWTPPACFANDTTITVQAHDGYLHDKLISEVDAADIVLTLVDGQPSTT